MFCQLHKYGSGFPFPGESVNQHIAVNELLEQQGLVLGITCKPYADILLPQGYGLHAGWLLRMDSALSMLVNTDMTSRLEADPGQDIVYISSSTILPWSMIPISVQSSDSSDRTWELITMVLPDLELLLIFPELKAGSGIQT